ncbi:MAG TPA: methylenetetrahydrofolate reductase [Pseudolabrys sp.]|nr:methylenetetrahydrofolate reductase [Pseudolabrys sp.]
MAALGRFSIEATRPSNDELAELSGVLAPGTPVYLSRVPTETSAEQAGAAARVRAAGFEPVPHVAARRLLSASELADFLARIRGEADVRRLLIIAGDSDIAGPFPDALSVIERGRLGEAGIAEIGIAGHPEGHPRIEEATLQVAMARKLVVARDAGLQAHVVSQFSFNPDRIVAWLRQLRADGIEAPVKVGMAGPTRLPALLRYAMRCGVKASVQGLVSGAATALVGHVGPDRILDALAAAPDAVGDIAAHFFSFGGLADTANYAARVARQPRQRAIKLVN